MNKINAFVDILRSFAKYSIEIYAYCPKLYF